jgi:hypothetical protein
MKHKIAKISYETTFTAKFTARRYLHLCAYDANKLSQFGSNLRYACKLYIYICDTSDGSGKLSLRIEHKFDVSLVKNGMSHGASLPQIPHNQIQARLLITVLCVIT